MKIGVQSAPLFDELPMDEAFSLLKETGFDAIDFNIDHELPGNDIVSGRRSGIFYRSEREVTAFYAPLREAADRHGIMINQVHTPFPTYVQDESAFESVMQALGMSICAAATLGARHAIVHPATPQYPQDARLEEEWDLNIRLYTSLIPALKKYKVICCLENMFTSHRNLMIGASCADPHEACRYIDALNDIAGERLFAFCLDVGHALLTGYDIRKIIHILGDRIETLHVHDNDGVSDIHMHPYMGKQDWNRFCSALGEANYQGVLSFETFNTLAVFPRALWPECLRLLSATGRLFVEKINSARPPK